MGRPPSKCRPQGGQAHRGRRPSGHEQGDQGGLRDAEGENLTFGRSLDEEEWGMKRLTVILAGLILCLGATPALATEPATDATQLDSCADELSNDLAQQHSVVVIEHFG